MLSTGHQDAHRHLIEQSQTTIVKPYLSGLSSAHAAEGAAAIADELLFEQTALTMWIQNPAWAGCPGVCAEAFHGLFLKRSSSAWALECQGQGHSHMVAWVVDDCAEGVQQFL